MASLSLIVTADDFGIGRETSRGIIRAHLQGPVTATSFMPIAGDHARASVDLLADVPNLDVGLHLVLTRCGEKPLRAKRSSGLVDRDGQFFTNGRLWMRAFTGRLNVDAVVEEIIAQSALFRQMVGRAPAYVDGHHHSHQLPTVRDALVEVIGRKLLPNITRVTVEAPNIRRGVKTKRLNRTAAHLLGRRAVESFRQNGIRVNDSFFGMLAPADLQEEFPWADYLANLPGTGVIEWVVHPGEPDETLAGRDEYDTARAAELTALTSPAGVARWEHLRPYLTRKSTLVTD